MDFNNLKIGEAEKLLKENGFKFTFGVDEVGRGPLAGPVVSAAVCLKENFDIKKMQDIKDSKKLSHKKRELLLEIIKENAYIAIGSATVKEIDSINILEATHLSMVRAIDKLVDIIREDYDDYSPGSAYVLIDGNMIPKILKNPQHYDINKDNMFNINDIDCVIKGDDKVLSISCASIVAKEFRDALMKEYSNKYSNYDWQNNAGYGTKSHLEAIKEHGLTEHHRLSFAPCKNYLTKLNRD